MKEIPLTQGKVALVDDEDYENLRRFKWNAYYKDGWYAKVNMRMADGKDKTVHMHRYILGAKSGQLVDHENGNGLDNQRHNIRIASFAQNQWNRRKVKGKSKFKGVYWSNDRHKWRVQIRANGNAFFGGDYLDEVMAAQKYDELAKKYHGEFARLNFPKKILK